MAVILSSADDSVLKDAVKAKQHVKISDLVAGDTSTSFTRVRWGRNFPQAFVCLSIGRLLLSRAWFISSGH